MVRWLKAQIFQVVPSMGLQSLKKWGKVVAPSGPPLKHSSKRALHGCPSHLTGWQVLKSGVKLSPPRVRPVKHSVILKEKQSRLKIQSRFKNSSSLETVNLDLLNSPQKRTALVGGSLEIVRSPLKFLIPEEILNIFKLSRHFCPRASVTEVEGPSALFKIAILLPRCLAFSLSLPQKPLQNSF